jgi:hypothetical protein
MLVKEKMTAVYYGKSQNAFVTATQFMVNLVDAAQTVLNTWTLK